MNVMKPDASQVQMIYELDGRRFLDYIVHKMDSSNFFFVGAAITKEEKEQWNRNIFQHK